MRTTAGGVQLDQEHVARERIHERRQCASRPRALHLHAGNNDTNTVRGNLAVISDGGFNFDNRRTGTDRGRGEEPDFISTWQTTRMPANEDITVGNNTNFNS